ncbi:hypothetical protein TNCV_911171 [Trichonephila clavipes]|uniref:Uncharacterized protein n=1 Tax=Trichonephila clavipes TaxID=2585209 RepID=A0A8X6W4E5_TRICX|nr:hypothetical protein TNCV_911171 [Trichonephila clavipes]
MVAVAKRSWSRTHGPRSRVTSSSPSATEDPRLEGLMHVKSIEVQGPCGRGRLVIKATDSKLAYHEFELSADEVPPCRGGRKTFNMSRLKRPPIGVVWKLGEGVPAQVSSSSLLHGSKFRGRHQ